MKPVWEILDEEVIRSVTLVEALEAKINSAIDEWGPDVLRVTASKGGIAELYGIYRQERMHLARTAKSSVDAGTAKLRVLQARTNAEAIVRVVTAALDAASLGVDERAAVVEALGLAMQAEGRGAPRDGEGSGMGGLRVIEGTAVGVGLDEPGEPAAEDEEG